MKGTIKKILALAGILSACMQVAIGQTIDLITGAPTAHFVVPIFQPNPGNPFVEQVGSPSTSVYTAAQPAGTTIYGGLPVTSAYDLVLLYSLDNSVTSPSQMSVATIVPFRTSSVASAAPAGLISSTPLVPIPGTTGGTPIAFEIGAFFVDPEIAAYLASLSSPTPSEIYAEAVSDFAHDPQAQMGWGQIVPDIVLGGQDTSGDLYAEPSTMEGWTSFSLVQSPEPSAWLLSLAGGLLLLSTRRVRAHLRSTPRSSTQGPVRTQCY